MLKSSMFLAVAVSVSFANTAHAGGPLCTPDASTAFTNEPNKVFAIAHPDAGVNALYSYCSNMTNEELIEDLDSCGAFQHPIDGVGYNPIDNFIYGVSPTDVIGVGAHLDLSELPFSNPGASGDIMIADPVALYRIGNDGGYQQIGEIQSAPESAVGAGENQVVPIMYNVSTFDSAGNMHILGYRTDYTSQAFPPEVNYIRSNMVIGTVSNALIQAATGGAITPVWADVDSTADPVCDAAVTAFREHTNTFSACVVDAYLMNGNDENSAVDGCAFLIEDKGINDFAVSPLDGLFYAYDTATYDDKDVLIKVDPVTMVASCSEIADAGNETALLNSLMFTGQNNLVGILANGSSGVLINTVNGSRVSLAANEVTPEAFGDGASNPFPVVPFLRGLLADLVFQNGFENNDPIFANGFEGSIMPPSCPDF